MQEKANIQTSTLRVPKNILEEIKIYCRKAGKPVGEWVETSWKFIEKNDFDIYYYFLMIRRPPRSTL